MKIYDLEQVCMSNPPAVGQSVIIGYPGEEEGPFLVSRLDERTNFIDLYFENRRQSWAIHPTVEQSRCWLFKQDYEYDQSGDTEEDI
ncbi:hypothetical protein EVB99_014 [Rhizobium phage RHph_N3_19]|nr:hypothetical protein EVB99_014 [Rhizobium phage RHph_N3_19]